MSVFIRVGDCLDTLRMLPAGTFQTCVTSPPYYGLRDYGVDGQIGLEPTPDEYIARMVEVFREVRRVLRDDGTVWLNVGDSYGSGTLGRVDGGRPATMVARGKGGALIPSGYSAPQSVSKAPIASGAKPKDLLGIPWMLAFALRADGWYLRSAIVWHKPNPMPESVRDRPTSSYEMVFLLSKRSAYFYDAGAIAEPAEYGEMRATFRGGGAYVHDKSFNNSNTQHTTDTGKRRLEVNTRNARNVWTIATQPYSGAHFATMPPDLAERCIKAGTSERGQCPHCGAAWGRVVEREPPEYFADTGKARARRETEGRGHRAANGPLGNGLGVKPSATTGWSPSCDCPAHTPVPQHVLDPFGGAGTTALVADRLGRNATICELNPAYAQLARERLTSDAPLLAQIA